MMLFTAGIDIFVRERAFSRFLHKIHANIKIVGNDDLAAWEYGQTAFYEIDQTTIKELLTGFGKATK